MTVVDTQVSRAGCALNPDTVRAKRRSFGLTQEQLARRAGLSHRTIQNAEGQRDGQVNVGTASKIARALGCDLGELI